MKVYLKYDAHVLIYFHGSQNQNLMTDIGFAIKCPLRNEKKKKNRIYSKQVLHLTSTPPLSKIRSAGILSIWQKETTSSHI